MRGARRLLLGVTLLAAIRLLLIFLHPSGIPDNQLSQIPEPLHRTLDITPPTPLEVEEMQAEEMDEYPSPPPSPPATIAPATSKRTKPFPIVLLAHERPTQLSKTLTSLKSVRGINASAVFVIQDIVNDDVAAAVDTAGFKRVLLEAGKHPTGDGRKDNSGKWIALAYHRALSHTFHHLTDDEAILVVEDDLLFSPDLMEYFLAGYHIMRADPTLWCVSAWNDNGFNGMIGSPKGLLRTGYFPGLGWLLTRKLYIGELEAAWPKEHWDHWMRSETVHKTSKGRECLFPQVPRTFHHGSRGTFMSPVLHEQLFADIRHNTDESIQWPVDEWDGLRSNLVYSAYESRLKRRIVNARQLTNFTELMLPQRHGEEWVLWYTQPPRSLSITVFADLSNFLGIWKEMRRTSHYGVHEVGCGGRATRLLLVNTLHGPDAKPSPYAKLAPDHGVFDSAQKLKRAIDTAALHVAKNWGHTTPVKGWKGRKQLKSMKLPSTRGVCRLKRGGKVGTDYTPIA